MGTVTKIARVMRKHELVRHLETDHFPGKPIAAHRTTKDELVDVHRMVHIGLGQSADHTHGTGR